MNNWILFLIVAALLGSALIGGMFFAFSTFIMQALARIPSKEGIRAMQSINIVVINPIVMGAFMGTAVLSTAIGVLVVGPWGDSLPHWFFVGSLHYVFGVFFVTALGNVPLNNRLEAVEPEDGHELWSSYLSKWTMFNHIRATAALIAVFCFTMGLLQL